MNLNLKPHFGSSLDPSPNYNPKTYGANLEREREREWRGERFACEKSWGEGQLKGWVILLMKKRFFPAIFILPISANFDQIATNTFSKFVVPRFR